MASFRFNGIKDAFYGDLHATGKDGVRFFTGNKVEVTRWLSEPGSTPDVQRYRDRSIKRRRPFHERTAPSAWGRPLSLLTLTGVLASSSLLSG